MAAVSFKRTIGYRLVAETFHGHDKMQNIWTGLLWGSVWAWILMRNDPSNIYIKKKILRKVLAISQQNALLQSQEPHLKAKWCRPHV